MESQATIEKDLEEALRMKDYDFFMELLMEVCGETLKRRIKFHSSNFLTHDEMREVYQKAMIEVYRKVQEPTFDPHRPLAFVNHLIQRRTLNARRSKRRQKHATNTDELLAAIATATTTGGTVAVWRTLSATDQEQFMVALREVIAQKLPEGQRIVAQAYFDNFVQVAQTGWSVLIDPIAAATGKRPTVTTIRSQWRNARTTILDELVRRGFGFLKGA